MIKFQVTIGIPGHLDAEDELSNLLQDEGIEEDLVHAMETRIKDWVMDWVRGLGFGEIKVEIKQE